ncbi:MAG: DUF4198 domain-containing protein [Reichenbachiella sp.]|uniref:DUF4198 domain-containing protein n=1 Tax=Reichenbachiella sp. TaxID=2184521 RepID=UPI003297A449
MKKSIVTFLFALAAMPSFAHYLWVETSSTGELNKEQTIKVHFGEYTYGVIEKVGEDSFNAVKGFTLYVIDPKGKRTALEVTAQTDHYSASFTPKKKGTYTVVLDNDQIDVIDYTKYDFGIFRTHYNSMAKVQVGDDEANTAAQNAEGIAIQQLKSESGIELLVTYKGEPLLENEVKVFVADQWSKTLETDKQGKVAFDLPWNGKYIVETTIKEEVPGQFRGEDYEFIWHCATTCITN